MSWLQRKRPKNLALDDRPHLTPEELIEFQARYNEVQRAKSQAIMLQESFLGWMRAIGMKYDIGTLFDVDPNDGTLIKRERPALIPPTQDGLPCPT